LEKHNASQLQKGERAEISGIEINEIPLKLIEMGCLPGNFIELVQIAPLGDPLFFTINDAKVAIRKNTAAFIYIQSEGH
jgi:ferrous iron transport protein A